MDDFFSCPMDVQAFLSAQLREMESALDGFPAAALLHECRMVDDRRGAVDRRAQALVSHILTEWASTIERDLERFPPATIEALQTIRQRMLDARGALLHLRSLLHELSEVASYRAERAASPARWPVLAVPRPPAGQTASARP